MENNIVFYVVGTTVQNKDIPVVLLTLTKTLAGWNQRSVEKGYNNDYVSHETVQNLKEWFACDLSTFKIFKQLEDAQSHHLMLQRGNVCFF